MRLKKGDIFIIVSVVLAFILTVVLLLCFSVRGSTVTVKQDNCIIYSESLYKNATVKLDGNIVVIKDGSAFMRDAECKNQICVNSGKISKKGESIICLPNKVTVEIK